MRLLYILLFVLIVSCKDENKEKKYVFHLSNPIDITTKVLDLEKKTERIKFEPLYIGVDKAEILYEAIGTVDFQDEIVEKFNVFHSKIAVIATILKFMIVYQLL